MGKRAGGQGARGQEERGKRAREKEDKGQGGQGIRRARDKEGKARGKARRESARAAANEGQQQASTFAQQHVGTLTSMSMALMSGVRIENVQSGVFHTAKLGVMEYGCCLSRSSRMSGVFMPPMLGGSMTTKRSGKKWGEGVGEAVSAMTAVLVSFRPAEAVPQQTISRTTFTTEKCKSDRVYSQVEGNMPDMAGLPAPPPDMVPCAVAIKANGRLCVPHTMSTTRGVTRTGEGGVLAKGLAQAWTRHSPQGVAVLITTRRYRARGQTGQGQDQA